MLVNNAGYGYLSAVEEGDDAEVRALFDTNFFGAVDMIKAVLPGMRARGSGHIVNISSMTGIVTNPPNTYYSSTKHALEALTEGLAKEVGPLGHQGERDRARRLPDRLRDTLDARGRHAIDDYAETSASARSSSRRSASTCPATPRKLAAAVLQVATLDDPPLRLLLGRDVLKAFREKLAAWSASVDEWEAVTKAVNFPEA